MVKGNPSPMVSAARVLSRSAPGIVTKGVTKVMIMISCLSMKEIWIQKNEKEEMDIAMNGPSDPTEMIQEVVGIEGNLIIDVETVALKIVPFPKESMTMTLVTQDDRIIDIVGLIVTADATMIDVDSFETNAILFHLFPSVKSIILGGIFFHVLRMSS